MTQLALAPSPNILEGIAGFNSLSAQGCRQMLGALKAEHHQLGAVIVHEGELGDQLFIVESGIAEVTTEREGKRCVLATVGAGEVFGELALLASNKLRQATVTAQTPMTLWCLKAAEFERVLATEPDFGEAIRAASKELLVAKFLKQASPFATLSPSRIKDLSHRLKHHQIAADEIIVHEGSHENDACYLIRSGSVEVLVNDLTGKARQVATLGPGALFGESALLTEAPRNATVRSLEKCELLALRRADLLAVLAEESGMCASVLGLQALRARPKRLEEVDIHHRETPERELITILKNPKDGTYFQLSEQGWFIWQRLDGQHTLRDLTLDLLLAKKIFAPDAILEVIERLTKARFVIEPKLGADVTTPKDVAGTFQRILRAVTIGLNWQVSWARTDPWFTRLHRSGLGLLLTPFSASALSALSLSGLWMGWQHRDKWFASLGSPPGGMWLILLLGVLGSVIAHELAHGLAVKAFNREVARIGLGWHWVMPMVFVDTSDIWLANRWPRIAVSLAGPWTNLLIAGIAAGAASIQINEAKLLWQLAAINLALVGLNMTPLLDLDGYDALRDLLQQPQLRSRAMAWLRKPNRSGARVAVTFWLAAVIHTLASVWIIRMLWGTIWA